MPRVRGAGSRGSGGTGVRVRVPALGACELRVEGDA